VGFSFSSQQENQVPPIGAGREYLNLILLMTPYLIQFGGRISDDKEELKEILAKTFDSLCKLHEHLEKHAGDPPGPQDDPSRFVPLAARIIPALETVLDWIRIVNMTDGAKKVTLALPRATPWLVCEYRNVSVGGCEKNALSGILGCSRVSLLLSILSLS